MNKKIVLIILFVPLAIFLCFGLFIFLSPYRVTKTTPENGIRNAPLNPEVIFTFNKNVKTEFIQYSISPETKTTADSRGNKLIISFEDNLTYNTVYSISIQSEKYKIEEYKIEFTTRAQNELPEDEEGEQSKAIQQLRNMLPLETKEYTIDYWREKDSFLITIKWPPCEESKQKVIDWLSSNQVDYTKIKTIWLKAKGLPEDCNI